MHNSEDTKKDSRQQSIELRFSYKPLRLQTCCHAHKAQSCTAESAVSLSSGKNGVNDLRQHSKTQVINPLTRNCQLLTILLTDTVVTLYSQLGGLCKWAQPSGTWAVQPGRLWRHCVHAHSKAVDSRRCGEFDQNLKKKSYLFIYLHSVAYDPEGQQKIDWIQNSTYKTILYLFIYYTNIQNVSPSRLDECLLYTLQPVVQLAVYGP